MGGSSKQTIGQRYFAKLTTFIGNPIEKLIGINFDNRGWIYKPDNNEPSFRIEKQNLYGDKEGGVAGFVDIQTGTADQLPNTFYKADFPKVSGYPYQSYLLFRGLGRGVSSSGIIGEIAGIIANRHHYNDSFYLGNSGYMKEMLLWPQRIHVRNDGREQWNKSKAEIDRIDLGESNKKQIYIAVDFSEHLTDLEFQQSKASAVNVVNKIKEFIDNGADIDVFFYFLGCVFNQSGQAFHLNKVTLADLNVVTEFIQDTQRVNMLQTTTVFYYCNSFFVGRADERVIVVCVANAFNGTESLAESYAQQHSDLLSRVVCKTVKIGIDSELLSIIDTTTTAPIGISSNALIDAMYYGITNKVSWGMNYADINPIHKIREILTDDTAMNKPESDVNDTNFKKAADVLFEEKLGISWSVTEKSCLDAINELCGHTEAGIRINRQTGLYEIVLFRDDWFSESEIHVLPHNKIKSLQLDVQNADESINQLNVSYYNRDAIKNSSFSIAENASIKNLQGRVNAETADFPYFMNQRNAAVVAQWKLKQMSTPIWQGTFTTGFYEARKWNRYDLLKLAWPRKWSGTILVRIMKINLGTGTDVSIDFVEVVPYSSDLSSNIVIDTPVDTTPKPPKPALFKAFELSYLEAVQLNGQKAVDDALAYNQDAGYAAVIAKRPQNNSLNALMYTDGGNGFERASSIQYCETAELDQSIGFMNTAFIVKNVGSIGSVGIGTQITIDSETMVYQSYDAETSLLTVKRGALDTIPEKHVASSMLYFADDFVTVDSTEYVAGEIIDIKALTTTPSGILSLTEVDAQQVKIQARAIRPYPPANVKINEAYYPETTIVSNNIIVTWVDRNRLQQTGGTILGHFDGGVTRENGVTYSLELSSENTVLHSAINIDANTYTIPASVLIQNKPHKLKLWSERDGYISYQVFEHSFFVESVSLVLTATVSKNNVTGSTVPVANISVTVDESLKANMKFDGSSISGKAQVGATITIEVEE